MSSRLHVFNSGVRLVHCAVPSANSIAIGVFVCAGSAGECDENNGISHFIEHMIFKGTQKRTALDISRTIDSVGAQINAFTSKQSTCYYTLSVKGDEDICLEILQDIVCNSVFDAKEIEKEKGVVLEEISMTEDDPGDLCMDNATQMYYGGKGLGYNILGTRERVKSFNRRDIIDYMDRNYVAGNVIVSIAGNISYEEALAKTEKYFADAFPAGKCDDWQDKPGANGYGFTGRYKDFEQANVTLVTPSFGYSDPMYISAVVTATVLGGSMSSRLFQSIREKQGLAYAIHAFPSAHMNGGEAEIYFATGGDNLIKAVRSVRAELDIMLKDGITDEELSRGKAQYKSAYLLSQESTASQMRLLGRHLQFTGKLFDKEATLNKIDSITKSDINAAIKTCLDYGKLTVAYVGKKIDINLHKIFTEG